MIFLTQWNLEVLLVLAFVFGVCCGISATVICTYLYRRDPRPSPPMPRMSAGPVKVP